MTRQAKGAIPTGRQALQEMYSDEAFSMAREIENGIKSGNPPFCPELWPRYFQLMGRIHFDKGEYPRASDYFQKTLQDHSPYHARVRAWALVRLGMIHDALKERTKAEDYYRRALEVPGGEGIAHVAAKQYLKTHYTPVKKEDKGRLKSPLALNQNGSGLGPLLQRESCGDLEMIEPVNDRADPDKLRIG